MQEPALYPKASRYPLHILIFICVSACVRVCCSGWLVTLVIDIGSFQLIHAVPLLMLSVLGLRRSHVLALCYGNCTTPQLRGVWAVALAQN